MQLFKMPSITSGPPKSRREGEFREIPRQTQREAPGGKCRMLHCELKTGRPDAVIGRCFSVCLRFGSVGTTVTTDLQ
eukprot:1382683-Amorphochlora_amoeboformis.AAC.1